MSTILGGSKPRRIKVNWPLSPANKKLIKRQKPSRLIYRSKKKNLETRKKMMHGQAGSKVIMTLIYLSSKKYFKLSRWERSSEAGSRRRRSKNNLTKKKKWQRSKKRKKEAKTNLLKSKASEFGNLSSKMFLKITISWSLLSRSLSQKALKFTFATVVCPIAMPLKDTVSVWLRTNTTICALSWDWSKMIQNFSIDNTLFLNSSHVTKLMKQMKITWTFNRDISEYSIRNSIQVSNYKLLIILL